VSDQKTCPACRVRFIDYPTAGGIVEDRSCTGRAGCVRDVGPRGMVGRIVSEHERLTTPDRENPAPESAPAGADVPVGKAGADIVERQIVRALLDTSVSVKQNALGVAMAEIIRLRTANARLQAEVERAPSYTSDGIRAIDLGPIVATALKESAP